jgi:protein SCO1/2
MPAQAALPYKRIALVLVVALLGLSLGAWLALRLQRADAPQLPPELAATVLPEPKLLSDFRALDQDRAPFGLARLEGHWSFLFFGYTHCPDVCPTTLATLAQVHDRLSKTAGALDGVQFVFVSVDPDRDTPTQLGSYVRYFDPSFIGVTAPQAELEQLTRQLGVLHVRAAAPKGQNYAVDHTASIFLVDPRARLRAVFAAPPRAEAIADAFIRIRQMES